MNTGFTEIGFIDEVCKSFGVGWWTKILSFGGGEWNLNVNFFNDLYRLCFLYNLDAAGFLAFFKIAEGI